MLGIKIQVDWPILMTARWRNKWEIDKKCQNSLAVGWDNCLNAPPKLGWRLVGGGAVGWVHIHRQNFTGRLGHLSYLEDDKRNAR